MSAMGHRGIRRTVLALEMAKSLELDDFCYFGGEQKTADAHTHERDGLKRKSRSVGRTDRLLKEERVCLRFNYILMQF